MPEPNEPAGAPELGARLHPDPPLWFARLLAALAQAEARGYDVAIPGYSRLLELGHADDGWLLLPLTGDGLDREPRTLPILMQGGEELAAITLLPGPQSGRDYLARQIEDARHAMGLAVSALRTAAYTGRAGAPAPSSADVSRQRGEALDALGAALGHTQLVGGHAPTPTPDRLTGDAAVDALRSAHGARLEILEAKVHALRNPDDTPPF